MKKTSVTLWLGSIRRDDGPDSNAIIWQLPRRISQGVSLHGSSLVYEAKNTTYLVD